MSFIERTEKDGAEQEPHVTERVRSLVSKVYGSEAGGDDYEEGYNRSAEFARELQKKYPDYKRYRVWHVLIGSTPDESGIIEEDFPGEDSVIDFLEKVLQERKTEGEE